MRIDKMGAEFEYEGVIYKIGQSVVATLESEYEGLYGKITEIRDGEDMETENETPDLYCTFELPVLPCEKKEMEKVFSELYKQPKKLENIALDLVILSPSMVMPLDDLQENRHHPMIYILSEDWAVDGEHGSSSECYTDFEDAKRIMIQKLTEEKNSGSILNWTDQEKFAENSAPDFYEAYLDGEYMENHYVLSITAQKLCASDRFIREMGNQYQKICQMEDFASKIADWDGVNRLTEEQYCRMIRDPRFPEQLEKVLGRNDTYWEAYWHSVETAAHEFTKLYLEENKGN